MPLTLDADFLAAALVGYQEKLKQIESQIAELGHRLSVVTSPTAVAVVPAGKKRTLSREGRAHIIAALKKRWAAVRKAKAAAGAKAKPAAVRKKAAVRQKAKPAKTAGPKHAAKAAKPAAPPKRTAIKKTAAKRPVARKAPAASQAVEPPAPAALPVSTE